MPNGGTHWAGAVERGGFYCGFLAYEYEIKLFKTHSQLGFSKIINEFCFFIQEQFSLTD